MPDDPQTFASVKAAPKPGLCSDRSYLVVGGLGGLGKAVVTWMVENGARHLVFLSRSGDSYQDTRDFLPELQSQGCQTLAFAGSVSRKADVEAAVQGASVPIAGVDNMSMVLKDISATYMTFEDWTTITQPKVQGTQNLHEAVTSDLDFLILFGSCSGIAGQWGQVNTMRQTRTSMPSSSTDTPMAFRHRSSTWVLWEMQAMSPRTRRCWPTCRAAALACYSNETCSTPSY